VRTDGGPAPGECLQAPGRQALALGRRSCSSVAATTPRATTPMMMVASALTSGETPSLTLEKITIGKVDAPGPDTKLAITRSSSESVNASSQPEISAGAIMGSVMSKKTRTGV